MATTYNPIKGPFESIPAKALGSVVIVGTAEGFGLHGRVPSKRPATPALLPRASPVSETPIGERVLAAGKSLFKGAQGTSFGRRFLGGMAREYYQVDVARRTVSDEFPLATREGAVQFVVNVTLEVRIDDPAAAVAEGVTDVRARLGTALRQRLARVARKHSSIELAAAQASLQASLEAEASKLDDIVRVDLAHVSVRVDAKAAEMVREVSEEDLRRVVISSRGAISEQARREQMAATRSPADLVAQWLHSKDDRYKLLLEEMIGQRRHDQTQQIEILKMMMENKIIEDIDVHRRFPDLVDRVLRTALPDAAPPA